MHADIAVPNHSFQRWRFAKVLAVVAGRDCNIVPSQRLHPGCCAGIDAADSSEDNRQNVFLKRPSVGDNAAWVAVRFGGNKKACGVPIAEREEAKFVPMDASRDFGVFMIRSWLF